MKAEPSYHSPRTGDCSIADCSSDECCVGALDPLPFAFALAPPPLPPPPPPPPALRSACALSCAFAADAADAAAAADFAAELMPEIADAATAGACSCTRFTTSRAQPSASTTSVCSECELEAKLGACGACAWAVCHHPDESQVREEPPVFLRLSATQGTQRLRARERVSWRKTVRTSARVCVHAPRRKLRGESSHGYRALPAWEGWWWSREGCC